MDKNTTTENKDSDLEVGTSKGSKTIVIIVAVVVVTIFMYMMFFNDSPEETEEQSNEELVIDGGTGDKISRDTRDIEDFDSGIIDTTLPGSDILETPKADDNIPALPELPELPEELRQQIASGAAKKEETYTKEEVESMINDRVKEMMENQMNNLSNLNKNQQQDQNKNSGITQYIMSGSNSNDDEDDGETMEYEEEIVNPANPEGPKIKVTKTVKKQKVKSELQEETEDDLGITEKENTQSEEAQLQEQQQKEADDLAKMQKQRAMQERKAAPLFTLNSGTGPANSLPQESDAIILSFTDSKLEVQKKEPDVVATQTTDLTRVILQGKIIEAILETAIDTGLSSSVRAVITRDVYAEEGKNILIPRGSRVIGTYDTSIVTGQTRVTINWTRIIRVDGMSLNITSTGTDRLGRAGVPGELDNKYIQRLANSFLASVLTVGTSILTEKINDSAGITSTVSSLTGETTTTSGKASDYALVEASEDFMDEAKEIIDGIAQQNPVIRIPQGERLTIMVTQDVTLPIFRRGS